MQSQCDLRTWRCAAGGRCPHPIPGGPVALRQSPCGGRDVVGDAAGARPGRRRAGAPTRRACRRRTAGRRAGVDEGRAPCSRAKARCVCPKTTTRAVTPARRSSSSGSASGRKESISLLRRRRGRSAPRVLGRRGQRAEAPRALVAERLPGRRAGAGDGLRHVGRGSSACQRSQLPRIHSAPGSASSRSSASTGHAPKAE